MTLKLEFALLADYALIDQHGKLSVLGIFHQIWVADFPATHPKVHLVLRVRGRRTDIGTHRMRIRFVDADDTELAGGEGSVQFGEPPSGVTDVEAGAIFVFDLPLAKAGEYAFEITLEGGGVTRVPIKASRARPTEAH